jgi:hypothetical protein
MNGENKMRRTILVCMMLYSLILISAVRMPAAQASINNYNWIGAVVRNSYDTFYGTTVTAYEEETAANLVVNVYNEYSGTPINVSAVKVGFDWGTNYTSSECSTDTPFVISSLQSHVFTINFTLPSTSFTSNLVVHSYTIYVEHVNSTSGNKRIVGAWTQIGSGFAVFSSDQKNAYNYRKEVEAYPSTPSGGIPFLTAEARELILRSSVAKSVASDSYLRGDFSSASNYYSDSLTFMQQAYSNETEKWSTFENALADILKGSGNLLTFQGYAWLLFGTGFLLVSIGVLVYLARKRPEPKTSLPSP